MTSSCGNGPSLQIQLFLAWGHVSAARGLQTIISEKASKPTPCYLVSDKQVTWIWRGAWFLLWPNCFMTWKAGGYILVCVRVCARTESGSYINTYFSQSFVSTKKERRGMFCRDGKRWERGNTKEEEESRGKEPCLFQNNLLSQSFWYLLLLRQRRKYAQRVLFLFLSSAKPSCWQALPRSHFFFQQGSVRVFVDEQGPECLCSEMDRLSSTLKKSLFPCTCWGYQIMGGWGTPPRPQHQTVMQFPRRQSCLRGTAAP